MESTFIFNREIFIDINYCYIFPVFYVSRELKLILINQINGNYVFIYFLQ